MRTFQFEWHPGTDALRRSPEAAEILGLPATEDTGNAYFARIQPADRDTYRARLEALTAAQPSYRMAYRVRTGDGHDIRLEEHGYGRFDEQGRLSSLIGIAAEVAEEPGPGYLEEIETIYHSAPVGLCVLDRELRFVRINERLAEINGVPAARHLGRTVREVLPGLADALEPQLRRVITEGEPVIDTEITGETPAQPGVPRTWIESWLPLRDADGQISGINIVAREVTEERKIREALAESRERYRLIADYTYDWEDWVGPDGTLRWVSPSCQRITGYPPDAFLSDPGLLERIAHPDDRAVLGRHLENTLHDPTARRLRFRIQRQSGEIRWVEHVCQPVYTADGRFAGRRASARDITTSKRAEEALRRREREFATLAENSPDIIVRFDRALRHLYVNAAVERATGRTAAEFLGKTTDELGLPASVCTRWSAVLREVFRSGEPNCLEFSLPAPDRERYFSLRAVPEFASDGSVETVLCTTRDDTAQREAEARARMLAAVVDASGDFISVADLDGRALYLNPAGQALIGLDGDAVVRATVIEDYLFPHDLPFVHTTVLPMVIREGRWAGEFRFRHFRTGEAIEVYWDLVRIDDPTSGQPVKLGTVTRDIREQKATEAALREADRRKDEFLAVLGHELRNPMAPIRNAVEVLQMLVEAHDPQIDWAMQVLDRQTAHLGRLLDDLLDVARIVRGKLKLERRPVRLGEIVQQAVDGVSPLMSERHHRFEVAVPVEEILVDGDPVRLSQILLNLLLNAAFYTAEGGDIGIDAQADAQEVVIRVYDNGPGIPPAQLENLFAPFTQGERGDRPLPSGLGLGLTISRRLAELHGGRLEATSAWPAAGSEFRVTLPRRAPSEASLRTAPPSTHGDAAGTRVLVVDDNADVAGAMALLLKLLGYTVDTAASGAEALALAAERPPRVALLDIGLPDMDGLELARRLRERYPDKNALMLVAVTGYGHDEARERSFAAGFDEHLAKPVDQGTLQAVLARAAGRQRAGGAADAVRERRSDGSKG